jgi:sugar lactone lactonase YvrE
MQRIASIAHVVRYPMVLVTAAAIIAAACGGGPEQRDAETAEAPAPAAAAPGLPDNIVAERGGFIPEGVEYDTRNGRLLTGSLAEGSIFHIQADGKVVPLVTDRELTSTIGIEADEERDRLLVANSDFSIFQGKGTGQAKLGVYNLTTGQRIAMVDLAAADSGAPADAVNFANDVTVGPDGTAYVTNSRTNVVYRVGPDYQASVLHRFPAAENANVNGIVYHSSGYLLVAAGTRLYKLPLDNPSGTTEVTLPEAIPGQDGMVWTSDNRLAIVSNSGNRVVRLTSKDDWVTAQLDGVAAYTTQATTAAVVGDDIYVVHPHFNDQEPPSIERVTFR